jgi:hypothetical protein
VPNSLSYSSSLQATHRSSASYNNSTTISAITERSIRTYESHFIQKRITQDPIGKNPIAGAHGRDTKLQKHKNAANAAGLASSALITTVLRDIQRNLLNRIRPKKTRQFDYRSQSAIPTKDNINVLYIYFRKYKSRMKWEIWSAEAPVIEESKASFKHQTSNIKRTSNLE